MSDSKPKAPGSKVSYAYEPDQTLKNILGDSVVLADIFSKEKIAACQKVLDKAKASFFETSLSDMNAIDALVKDGEYSDNYQELCRQLFQPICNIRGQAKIFGFPLVDRICKYLIEYCEDTASSKKMRPRDIFILGKLVESLHRTFQEKIMDAGGTIERELISVIELVRK